MIGLIRSLQDYENPHSLASRFRRRRARRVAGLIAAAHAETGACRIIDLGGRPLYWRTGFEPGFLEAHGVHVTTVNFEDPEPSTDPMFTHVQGDALDLKAYADDAFDLCHSNSVIEHVGDWPNVEAFARETRRIARRYYVQTPYVWFPVEPHFSTPFFHWLPEATRARALSRRDHGFMERTDDLGLAMRAVQHARLLDKRMFRYLFPDARHEDEKVAGLTKSLMALRG